MRDTLAVSASRSFGAATRRPHDSRVAPSPASACLECTPRRRSPWQGCRCAAAVLSYLGEQVGGRQHGSWLSLRCAECFLSTSCPYFKERPSSAVIVPRADVQAILTQGKSLGRLAEQQLAHLSRGVTHRGAAVLQRMTAGGVLLIRRQPEYPPSPTEAVRASTLSSSAATLVLSVDALPELGLAGEHGNLAVCIDTNPSVKVGRFRQASGQRCRLRRRPAATASGNSPTGAPPRETKGSPRNPRVGVRYAQRRASESGDCCEARLTAAEDSHMRAAAAQIRFKRSADLCVARVRITSSIARARASSSQRCNSRTERPACR